MSMSISTSMPGRLPASAYAPFGEPLSMTPGTRFAPRLALAYPGSYYAHYYAYGSETGTPPPPYTDSEGDYDRFPAYMSSDGGDFDDGGWPGESLEEEVEQAGAVEEAAERMFDAPPYEEAPDTVEAEADGEDSEDAHTEEFSERSHEELQDDSIPLAARYFGPTFKPEDLAERLAATSVAEPNPNAEPHIFQSSSDFPQPDNEEWSFPPPVDREKPILRVRQPVPGTTCPLDPVYDRVQVAFITHLNSRAPSGTFTAEGSASEPVYYTDADVEEFRAIYPDTLRREQEEAEAADLRDRLRVARQDMMEWEQREQERRQEEIARVRAEYIARRQAIWEEMVRAERAEDETRAQEAAAQRLARQAMGNNHQQVPGMTPPPIPPRPIGEVPRLIAHTVPQPSVLQLPPAPTRSYSPPRLNAYRPYASNPYSHGGGHHYSELQRWAPAQHASLPHPISMENVRHPAGPSTSISAPAIRRGYDKPLPPVPAPSNAAQPSTSDARVQHVPGCPHADANRAGASTAPNATATVTAAPLRLRPGPMTGQQLAERYQRRR